MAPADPAASIGRLIGLTVITGVVVGVSTGLLLAWLGGPRDRTLFAALTASITSAVTTVVVSSRMRGESGQSAP